MSAPSSNGAESGPVHLEQGPLRVRCSRCDAEDIVALCHECGRPFCEKHRPHTPWYKKQLEFRGLRLQRTAMGENAVHCDQCDHETVAFELGLLAAILLAIATMLNLGWILLRSGAAGDFALPLGSLSVLIVALLLILVSYGLYLYAWLRQLRRPPALPLLGDVPAVTVTETVHGRIELDTLGNYRAPVGEGGGSGAVALRLPLAPPDQERYQAYSDSYRRPPSILNAGFVLLTGSATLSFPTGTAPEAGVNTVVLQRAEADRSLFDDTGRLRAARWLPRYGYTFATGKKPLPIQLIPTLVRVGERWGLELLVQADPRRYGPDDRIQVERLELYVPRDLDEPKVWRPAAQIYRDDDGHSRPEQHMIVWQEVPLYPEAEMQLVDATAEGMQDADPHRNGQQAPHYPFLHRTFFVRFANDPTRQTMLHGRLDVRVQRSLFSGAEGVRVFYPLGPQNEEARVDFHTDFCIDFTLHLAGLPFSRRHVLTWTRTYQGVRPGHREVKRLVETITDHGVYVKRVVENPARTTQTDARVVNRFWELAGRLYQGLFAIDFELVLVGTEPWAGSDIDEASTKVEIRVQSILTEEEMEKAATALLQRLIRAVEFLFGPGAGASGAVPPPTTHLPLN